jgi:dolichol kinase
MIDKAARANRYLTWFMVVLFSGIALTYLGYGLLTVGSAQMATHLVKLVDNLMVPVMTGILLGGTVGLLMGRMSDRR